MKKSEEDAEDSPEGIFELFAEALEEIDPRLAGLDVPLSDRPFHAVRFVCEGMIFEVHEGDRHYVPDYESHDYLATSWFAEVFSLVDEWYRKRYPATNLRVRDTIQGVVLIWNTPFELEIPKSHVGPGEKENTISVRWPDRVLDFEDPLDWLVNPPHSDSIGKTELQELKSACKRIATLRRRISVQMAGLGLKDPTVGDYVSRVRSHLDAATHALLNDHNRAEFVIGPWDLQMAPELALKALILHETGHRIGAIRSLQWGDVDLGKGLIKWRAESDKNGFEHVTPLSPAASTALESVRRRHPSIGKAWILPSPKDETKPCAKAIMKDWWKKCESLAELEPIPWLGWHSLRRKFATEMKDIPLRDLCELGGWKSPHTILKCYQRPELERMKEALKERRKLTEEGLSGEEPTVPTDSESESG